MLTREYRGIRYDDPRLQAEFERLLAEVERLEQARRPIEEEHRRAELAREEGDLSEREFRTVDDRYIAMNNQIAAAKRRVDQFLQTNKNYRVERVVS
ncbi:hypothetical protein [Kallotenue papyrolyticum]|uniref:hypothetical protein n=1 Tax=Kallotenue papyrolyticum TaxID=1325125 RepID=UPI0004786180|nr:hypothetical protein [Kallotenue papyrolyticum]